MPKRLQLIDQPSGGFTVAITAVPERKCQRCGCTDSRACPGGCSWPFPRADICSKCWTPADTRLVEERELLEDSLESLHDHLFHVDHLIEFYGGKGTR